MRMIRIFFLCLLTMTGVLTVGARERLFKDIVSIKGVQSIYIPSAALERGATANGAFTVNNKDYSKSIKKLNGIEIITCSNKSCVPEVQKKCKELMELSSRDLLLEIIDDKETLSLYALLNGNSDMASDMILEIEEKGNYTIIYLQGDIDVKGVISTIQPSDK